MAYLQGKNGSVKIGSTAIDATEWDSNLACDIIDTSNMTSGGYKTNLDGLIGGEFSVKGVFNSTAVPSSLLTLGSTVSLNLYTDAGLAHGVTCTARVATLKYGVNVTGAVTYEFTAQSSGSITLS